MPCQLSLPGIAMPAPVTDRLFFALLPDPAVARQIRHVARELRRGFRLRSRLIETHRLHMSLHHLGDHAGIPMPWIYAARHAASRIEFPAFDIHLDRLLTFSGRAGKLRRLPCVLTTTPDAIIHRFHRALGSALRDCGLAIPSWSFTPHLTMFYVETVLDERAIEPIRFAVHEFVIVHSRIGTGQPYELLGRWPLIHPPKGTGARERLTDPLLDAEVPACSPATPQPAGASTKPGQLRM